jgi:hypothetical protein
MLKFYSFVLMSALAATGTATSARAEILKKEPPMGQLREGQTVLVDDGTCPQGQIKKVIGGNHTKVGGTKQILRNHQCVPR